MRSLGAAAATALLLSLAACGGGSSSDAQDARSADDTKASKAIADSIMKSQEESQGKDLFSMDRGEADCIGNGFVDDIGTEKLQKYGFLTKDLKTAESMGDVKMSPEDAKSASDTLFDCTDVSKMMSDALAAGGTLDKKTQACLEDAVTEDKLREMFTLMFSGEQEKANEVVTAPMMKCATAAQ